MSDTTIPAPKNALVAVINAVTQTLISGAGVQVAVKAAQAELPALALPFINGAFTWLVQQFADVMTTTIKNQIDVLVIRFQGEALKNSYDAQVAILKKQLADSSGELKMTKAQLDALKLAFDRVVNRNRLV